MGLFKFMACHADLVRQSIHSLALGGESIHHRPIVTDYRLYVYGFMLRCMSTCDPSAPGRSPSGPVAVSAHTNHPTHLQSIPHSSIPSASASASHSA